MKILNLILITFLISFTSLSQTKIETEEWINDNINKYPVSYGNNTIKVAENIYVENEFLYFYHHWEDNTINYYSASWQKVKLKDITSIHYSYNHTPGLNNHWITISFVFNEGKSYKSEFKKGYQSKNNTTYTLDYESTQINIRCSINFEKEGMKQRIEKAFLHLIKLYGGSAKVKREPF